MKSPAIFIDNGKERKIHTEIKITDHTQRYTVLEREPYSIVEQIQEQENIQQLTIRKISLLDRR